MIYFNGEFQKMSTNMKRLPSPQQITWFLDLDSTGQLNLDPPYQRKSVWTTKDRKFFLDTIFRNYPCPTIFIHKVTDDDGKTTYNVVDGKQRLQTILMFKNNDISIDEDYGDVTYDGKKFSELTPEQKRKFWNYVIVVDFVDLPDSGLINEVFDRLNRNVKKLNEQELRHAKYSGWFITEAEKETEHSFWEKVKISTKAKNKRMKDVQFVSELLMIILERKTIGFSQDHITEVYAKYDNLSDVEDDDFDEDIYLSEKERIRNYLDGMESSGAVITKWATTANNFYTLWSLVALEGSQLPDSSELAEKYDGFMEKVNSTTEEMTPTNESSREDKLVFAYYANSRGASTDLKQRTERFNALKEWILSYEGA